MMDKKKTGGFPVRYLLFLLTFVCLSGAVVTFLRPGIWNLVKSTADEVFMPMQIGLNRVGLYLSDQYDRLMSLRSVEAQNDILRAENERLKEENMVLYQQTFELSQMRELLSMQERFSQYEIIGAHVIQKETGNWFHEFLIDKGSRDGVRMGANILSGGALVGRVVHVGKNYARVLSIIDDESNVGAMSRETADFCIVSGDLELFSEGKLSFGFADKDARLAPGDLLITSYVSDIYLPDLPIGYIESVNADANNLTMSGILVPIADFDKIQTVDVILTSKSDWIAEEETASGSGENASAGVG